MRPLAPRGNRTTILEPDHVFLKLIGRPIWFPKTINLRGGQVSRRKHSNHTNTATGGVKEVPPRAALFSILEDFRPGLRTTGTTGMTEASADAAEREAHPASICRKQKMGWNNSKPIMMEVVL